MVARTADLMGIDHIGLGSDLCQDQPNSVVEWMRVSRWTKGIDYGEGSASDAGFPADAVLVRWQSRFREHYRRPESAWL